MKRLIAYLFIFLCFGLVSNLKAHAEDKTYEKLEGVVCGKKLWNDKKNYWKIFIFSSKTNCKKLDWDTVSYKEYQKLLKKYENYEGKKFSYSSTEIDDLINNSICINKNSNLINNLQRICSSNEVELFVVDGYDYKIFLSSNKTQIAKAEPSQTQRVARKDQKHLCVNEFNEKLMIVDKILKDQNNQCKYKFYRQDHSYIYKRLVTSAYPSQLTGASGSNNFVMTGKVGKSKGISKEGFNNIIAEGNKEAGSTFAKVKAEPSQTQKTDDVYKLIKNTQVDLRTLERAIYSSSGDISFETADAMIKSIENNLKTLNKNKNSINSKGKETIKYLNLDVKTAKRLIYDGKTLVSDGSKLTKTEPSQTQKVANNINESFCVIKTIPAKNWMAANFFLMKKNSVCNDLIIDNTNESFKKLKSIYANTKEGDVFTLTKDKYVSIFGENIITKSDSVRDFEKKEKTITPKKKIEVVKVEEPKQEEFKPENKDIDNDAPIIEIAQNITVDSQTYTLKGKVKDKSKLYLEANGRPLKISKRGNFELEGFVVDPDAGDKIKIVAIDQWKNKSEKTINIKVEFKEITELRSYEKPNPSKIKVKQDKNKIAIIIGIEKYKTLKNIDAPYANRDANAFRAYANRALGIPNKNIKVLIDENATRGETLKTLTLWLPQIARGKNKDIYVFFAGHGLASDDGKNLYILPQDGDAALLQYTALSRLEIFDLINRVEPKSVTMFFDTCYSGQTRDERMLVAGLRPIRLVAEEQEVQNNFTIFTASNYDQTSGSIEEAKHGIFSYYLMMGMQGKADSNQDKKITNGELITYLKQNVSEEAFINNRQQEPMLSGDPDKVLISYR